MRIAIDGRKLQDFGIGTYVRGLIRAIVETSSADIVALGDETALLAEFGTRVMAASFDAPLYSLRELMRAQRVLDAAGAVDVFHAPHYTLPFVDVPTVVTIHDLIHLERRGMRYTHQRIYAARMLRSALNRAGQIITVSEATADALRARFDIKPPIHVIPNGVDASFREPLGEEVVASTLQRLGVRPGAYFLYVGNDLPHKNLQRIVNAFEQSRPQHRRDLVLVGGASAQRRRSHVVPLARVGPEELRALYAGAVALVLVSEQEGFGLPAAEAMACGTPVIVSDIAALREVTSGSALLVDPFDEAAIGRAMVRVAAELGLRTELSGRGLEVAARYDWSATAEKTLEVYSAAAR